MLLPALYSLTLLLSGVSRSWVMVSLCACLSAVPILLYNGKPGLHHRALTLAFYAAYPLHLCFLLMIRAMRIIPAVLSPLKMRCAESLSAHIFDAFCPILFQEKRGIFTFQELQAKVKRAKEALIDYAYLVTLGAMIAVIAATRSVYRSAAPKRKRAGSRARAGNQLHPNGFAQNHADRISPAHARAFAQRLESERRPSRFGRSHPRFFRSAGVLGDTLPAGRHTPLWISKPRQARRFSACATAS